MSLRRYLFMLIGGLIVLLTVSQLLLLYWLEKNVEQDVNTKVRHINEKALDVALDKILITGTPTLHIPLAQESRAIVQSKATDIKETTAPTIKIIELAPTINPTREVETVVALNEIELDKKILKREFKSQIEYFLDLEKKYNKEKVAHSTFVINKNNGEAVWTSTTETSNTKKLIQSVQTSLIIGAIIALVFAYWLSIQFNKPLKALSNGFKELAFGNYKGQVDVIGVAEIRETIIRFNDMVCKLDSLSQAEQHHKEIAHLAELGEVSRGLAHALRNPIHTIGLSVEELLSGDLDTNQQQKLLSTIQQKLTNLDKSIKGLLTLTTSGIDRSTFVPLLAVVQDIILEFKTSYAKKITFKTKISNETMLKGAESEIRSILHTLISNACEASLDNAMIEINAACSNNTITITVIDFGNGLDEKIESELFKPHISTKPEGAGMGLYIAKRLITLHYQGDINLENIKENDRVKGCRASATFTLA